MLFVYNAIWKNGPLGNKVPNIYSCIFKQVCWLIVTQVALCTAFQLFNPFNFSCVVCAFTAQLCPALVKKIMHPKLSDTSAKKHTQKNTLFKGCTNNTQSVCVILYNSAKNLSHRNKNCTVLIKPMQKKEEKNIEYPISRSIRCMYPSLWLTGLKAPTN